MKKNRNSIIIGIFSVAIGFFLIQNFNYENFDYSMNINAKEYQKAQQEKDKLMKRVEALKKDNDEVLEKISIYNMAYKNERILKDMKEQSEFYGMVTGSNEVKGPGIKITAMDGDINYNTGSDYEKRSKIIHDYDMNNIINAIRIAGAESISINNHRVALTTTVQCNGAFLLFEDGSLEMAPFNIYAIGDPETLKLTLAGEGSYLKKLKARGIKIEIESSSEIKMPSINVREIKFAKEFIKNKLQN